MSDDDYASSNEGSGRRFASSHGRNGSTASRLSETAAEDFVGAPQDSQPANAIREQQQECKKLLAAILWSETDLGVTLPRNLIVSIS